MTSADEIASLRAQLEQTQKRNRELEAHCRLCDTENGWAKECAALRAAAAQHAPTQGGDWAEAAAEELFAYNVEWGVLIGRRQHIPALAAIIRRHAPQPDLASVREAVNSILHSCAYEKAEGGSGFDHDLAVTELMRAFSHFTPLLGANEDRERLDWLEQWILSLSRLTSPDMSGIRFVGQYHNPAKERGEAGPSYLRIQGQTIRAAIDNAARHSAPKEGGAL